MLCLNGRRTSVLRDQAVDDAMEKAKTDLLYKKYLEREQYVHDDTLSVPYSITTNIWYFDIIRKKWKQQEIKYGPRPTIQDADPYENKGDEFDHEDDETDKTKDEQQLENANADYDSLDELEKEILGDDDDEELARIQAKRKQQLKNQWKKKQEEMAQLIYNIYKYSIQFP